VNVESFIPVHDQVHEGIGCFSPDGLEMYLESDRGYGGYDLWVSRRASIEDDWAPPENLGPVVNSPKAEGAPSISTDGLTLYFVSDRLGGYGDCDIYLTTRATKSDPWGPPVNLGPKVNGSAIETHPWISPDGLELYFHSSRPGGYGNRDLYAARRKTINDPWDTAVNLGPVVNSPYVEMFPSLSPDGLLLFFSDGIYGEEPRPGGYGHGDIWMARRAELSDPWQAPVNLGPKVNGPSNDGVPRISPDGRTLYFWSDRAGYSHTSWQAAIIPIVDFNGDGKVDGKEVLALAQHWGQKKSLFDIGLSPMGDGIVDINDLTVLARYIGQDVNDPTLIAHWALDEAAGTTPADSAGNNNLTVTGNATWQPSGGKIGGALAFDGKDGFAMSAKPVLDPAKGPLSVIASVKGGAPNRVIVSQASGADWLYLNQYGMLTTDLKAAGRDSKSLTSSAYVLDDHWHRVVLTWDGTNRTLQMDGVEVARDTQSSLAASSGNLQIGVGRNFSLGTNTFWSGLIDDVRVYNRVVQP